MELLENIGVKLKALRKEKDETLEEVANVIGSSKSLLSKYERGVSEPGLRVLKKLADHFNVSLDYLFGFTNDRQPIVTEKIQELFAELDESKKKEALRYLQFLNSPEEE
ncbi:helix-turn-helix transcriptional regulator [Desulfosporosinus sp.]|uniref:helix-turn-helix domain-containing protein n=1 Tax=Desulfosporosinus sp. TaxID=157907 RepID=UPI0025C654D7|nr:helix-turn-helix transcriptional regulator [Desulfosporosinus sp.]MBC2727615.1 helix-turn-helix transcriptional regulator [Desulfosporosinus sp.]